MWLLGVRTRRRRGGSAAPHGSRGGSAVVLSADETRGTVAAANLAALPPGATGRVRAVAGGTMVITHLASLGFVPGTHVTMVQNYGSGPLIVEVRGTRVALGRREAGKVFLTLPD